MKYYTKSFSIPEVALKALEHKLDYEHHPIPNENGFKVRWKNFSEIASYYIVEGLGGDVKRICKEWYENHSSARRNTQKARLRADSLRLGDELDMTTSIGLEKQLATKKMEAWESHVQVAFFYSFIFQIQKDVDLATILKAFDAALAANEGISGMTREMPQFLEHLRKKVIEDSGESPLEHKASAGWVICLSIKKLE